MDKLNELEKTAVDVVRGAGRYGVYLSHLGFEVAGVADWLELQIPRFRRAVLAMARAAGEELAHPEQTAPEPGERSEG
jgi:hypothetical protein